ncbi:T9SS type A sorting domain-containing protein [Psychroserpens sp. AS72]|uniref:T9SS type A sorting domain-containing protein n=1 Tax=Psychroserpens sp. AS72 TaxID=3135775 RepID=UPI003175BA35
MLKKYTFVISFLCILRTVNAQVTEVISGLTNPSGMVVDGNFMYISDRNDDTIIKIDLTQENPTPTTIVSGLSDPTAMAIYGTDLYIAETNSNKITKIDISLPNPTLTTFTTDVTRPTDIEIKDNMLYISEVDGNRISKIDMTQSTPAVTTVIAVTAPFRIGFLNNELYAVSDIELIKINEEESTYETLTNADQISFTQTALASNGDDLYVTLSIGASIYDNIIKLDLSTNPISSRDIVSGPETFANDLVVFGDELYNCNSLLGAIYKTDLTNLRPTPTDVQLFNYPQGIVSYDDHFYLSEFGQSRISKLTITDGVTSTIDLIQDENVRQMVIKDDQLYFASEFHGILKADLTETSLPITPVLLTNLSQPYGVAIHNNDLYFSDFSNGRIRKIDLLTNTTSLVITGLSGPSQLAIKDDELFIAEFIGDKISKINLTEATPVAIDVAIGINSPFAVTIKDNDLYFADTVESKIFKLDLDSTSPTIETVIYEASEVQGMNFKDNVLYLLETTKLSMFDFQSSLSVEHYNSNDNLILFPNPSEESITIRNLINNSAYVIYNNLGQEVKKGMITINSKTIDINTLSNGIYILKLANYEGVKFIKE